MTTKNLSKATCKSLQNHFQENSEFPKTVTVGKKTYDFVEFMEDKGFYTATYELGDKLVQGSFTIENQTLKNTTMKISSVKKEMLAEFKLLTKDLGDKITKEQLVSVLKKVKNNTDFHNKVIKSGGVLQDFVAEFNLVFVKELDTVKSTVQEAAKVEEKKTTAKKEVVKVNSSPKIEDETELQKMIRAANAVNDEAGFKKLNAKIKKAGFNLISRRTGDVIVFKASHPSKRNPEVLAGEFETAEGKSVHAQYPKFGRFISIAEAAE